MPSDSFALAVGVGSEINIGGLKCRAFNFFNHLPFFCGDNVFWGKTVFNIYGVLVAFGEVADMPNRSKDFILLA